MRKVDSLAFTLNLQVGDIGIIRADNFFSTVQNWMRIKMEDCPSQFRASHSFIMKKTPFISEANGLKIFEATILKDIGDKTICWIYRYSKATGEDRQAILDYCKSQEGKTFYSVLGIAQFGVGYIASFFNKRIKFKDQPGKFCSEYCEDMMKGRGWPIRNPSYGTSPSSLNYYLQTQGLIDGYEQVGFYDGNKGYFIA